jgi:site-specific recombinase XerD
MEATTRNRKLTAIRSFCKYLVKEGYIENNPTVDIPYANTNKKLPQTITIEQTVDILDSADSLRDRAVLETMYGTGCRVGELVAIRLIDFNLDGKIIRLFGKGRKERIVPLSQGAVDAIKKYVDSRNDRSQYLFPSPNNKYEKDNFIDNPITTRAMYNIVSKYGDANNVSMSPHKFRHSFATHLLSGDVDIRTIQQLLGHANINTTTIYAQVAIDKMSTEFHRAHPRG